VSTLSTIRFIILAISLGGSATSVKSQPLPPEIPDFDRPLSFTSPLLVTVVRAYGLANLFELIPNQLELKKRADGSPDITLYYNEKMSRSYLTINVRIGLDKDRLDRTQEEIRLVESNARYLIAEPISSTFYVNTPGVQSGSAIIREAKVTRPNEFALTFDVDDIFRRIFLIPTAYISDFFSIRYEGTYRGILRDENGAPKIGTRVYAIGSSYGGMCALYPAVAVDLATGKDGCAYPKYKSPLIRAVQRELKRLGLLSDPIDGAYGTNTHKAIQRFQARAGMTADGIPTDDLLIQLKETAKVEQSASR
jgi:Putative peptidoglycan binding domain